MVGAVAKSFFLAWNRYSEELIESTLLTKLENSFKAELSSWWTPVRLRLVRETFDTLDTEGCRKLNAKIFKQFIDCTVSTFLVLEDKKKEACKDDDLQDIFYFMNVMAATKQRLTSVTYQLDNQ